MNFLGYRPLTSPIETGVTTHAAAGGAVAPSSPFEVADFRLYKNGSSVERTSQAGWTITSPFDSLIGLHLLVLDPTDNTDAGFYAAGGRYAVVLSPDETIDAQTPIAVVAEFILGPAPAADDSAGVTTLLSRLSAARAGYLDNLSAGAVALESSLQGLITTIGAAGAGLTATATAVWAVATRVLTAGTNIISAALTAKLTAHAAGVLVLVVETGSTSTAVVFKTVEGAAPSAVNDFYTGRVIVFTSGTLAGQATPIDAYVGGTGVATVPTLTGAPANNDTAVIV